MRGGFEVAMFPILYASIHYRLPTATRRLICGRLLIRKPRVAFEDQTHLSEKEDLLLKCMLAYELDEWVVEGSKRGIYSATTTQDIYTFVSDKTSKMETGVPSSFPLSHVTGAATTRRHTLVDSMAKSDSLSTWVKQAVV